MTCSVAYEISVEVSTAWTSPEAPRDIDSPAIAAAPDIGAWLTALDAVGTEARSGLHGRMLTQLVNGEPVDVIEESGDWARVVAPWQPSPDDNRGYPGWVPRSHLEPRHHNGGRPVGDGVEPDRLAICDAARVLLGLPYLWGGTTSYGLDCSGLVHHSYRRAGVIVPRDAHPQFEAAVHVDIGDEQPGDLYFFAEPDGHVHHVGFVTGNKTMLHAPETGKGIEESRLSPSRLDALFAVGRLLE